MKIDYSTFFQNPEDCIFLHDLELHWHSYINNENDIQIEKC